MLWTRALEGRTTDIFIEMLKSNNVFSPEVVVVPRRHRLRRLVHILVKIAVCTVCETCVLGATCYVTSTNTKHSIGHARVMCWCTSRRYCPWLVKLPSNCFWKAGFRACILFVMKLTYVITRRRWKDNIKTDFQELEWEYWLGLKLVGWCLVILFLPPRKHSACTLQRTVD
jgi:hypothetical protein